MSKSAYIVVIYCIELCKLLIPKVSKNIQTQVFFIWLLVVLTSMQESESEEVCQQVCSFSFVPTERAQVPDMTR